MGNRKRTMGTMGAAKPADVGATNTKHVACEVVWDDQQHLAGIGHRTGRTLRFDPETERFPGDEEANRLLTRAYRPPFVVPEKVWGPAGVCAPKILRKTPLRTSRAANVRTAASGQAG